MLNAISIMQPAAFLILLPLLALFTVKRLPSPILNTLRVLLYLLIAAAMGGISIRLPDRAGTVVVLADRSLSMPAGSRSEMESLIKRIEKDCPESSRLGVISFAGGIVTEKLPDSPAFEGLRSMPENPHATSIDKAIDAALAMIPADQTGRILLLSDGLSTAGNIRSSIANASARNIPIDYRPIIRGISDDTAILSVDAPLRAAPGEIYTLVSRLYSPAPRDAVCRIRKGGGAWMTRDVHLRRGITTISWRDKSDSPGTANYEIELVLPGAEKSADPVPENNLVRRIVSIEGSKPILLLTQSPSQNLAKILRSAGLNIRVEAPSAAALAPDALAGVSAVLFENVRASSFSPDALTRLRELVRTGSIGFLMTGGRSSFAVGGYYKSEIEELLPVTLEQKNEIRKTKNAIMIALDRSGSMGMVTAEGFTKMSLANNASLEVLSLLSDFDDFGLIAVDSSVHNVVPLMEVKQAKGNAGSIRAIEAGGGGIFTYTALKAAFAELERSNSGTRHLILFADAADAEEPGDYVRLLAGAASKGITVSVIGLGSKADSDAIFLMDVAKRGGGIAYFTDRAEELPRIFAEDTFVMVRNTFLTDPVHSKIAAPARSLPGSQKFPASFDFNGFNLCFLRHGCEAFYVTDDDDRAPIAAAGQFGLGRSAAFCAEADGRYTGPFASDPAAAPFLASLVSWTAATDDEGADYMITQELSGSIHRISLELDPARKRDPFNAIPSVEAVFCADSGETAAASIPMIWDGPDRLVCDIPLSGGNVMLGSVHWDDARPHALAPVELPYSPEFTPSARSGREIIDEFRASGGQERTNVEEIWNTLPKRPRAIPITPFLCAAAILLFLLEIAERRFLILSRFFLKSNKPAGSASGKAADTLTISAKLLRKRRKSIKGKDSPPPESTLPQQNVPPPQEKESDNDMDANDALSSALKKVHRR